MTAMEHALSIGAHKPSSFPDLTAVFCSIYVGGDNRVLFFC